MKNVRPTIPRATTGVSGLDHILMGGLPGHRIYLLEGDPGAGKTTLALQFLLHGASRGDRGLYITLSETQDELEEVAVSHGWSLDSFSIFELSALDQLLKSDGDNTFFRPSEVELNKTVKVILDEIEKTKPTRVVFDSLSELRLMAETPLRFRRQMLSLKQFFAGRHCTVLFLDDQGGSTAELQIESIAHGVIRLERLSPAYGATRRMLNVIKMRGVKYREGFHDFAIEKGGLTIYPRLSAAEHHAKFPAGVLASGVEGLDALLGGGLDRGTSTIIMGPPGTGKSSCAMQFGYAAAAAGMAVDFFGFDETLGLLKNRSRDLNMDLDPFIASGLLRLNQIDPAEISPGELTCRIRQSVEERNVRLVLIDSINGYLNAMPEERYLSLQLHELLAYLNQQGVVTIMVVAQQGLVGQMQSVIDLTYLADTVVLHRFFEVSGEVRRAISVIKKRSGSHERTIREFTMQEGKIQIGPPLKEFHGILTGVPEIKTGSGGENLA